MSTSKPTNLASLGRPTAAITFTRINNKSIQARNGRQATTQPVTTQPRCVAWFKNAIISASTLILTALAVLTFTTTPAQAEPTPGTGWESFTNVYPTNLQPGGTGRIQIQLLNTGAKPSAGAITVTDVLPPGVTATAVGGLISGADGIRGDKPESIEEEEKVYGGARWSCHGTTVVTCTSTSYLHSIPYGEGQGAEIMQRLAIDVAVQSGLSGTFSNSVTVAGGGATAASVSSDPLTIGSGEPGYGFSGFDVWFSGADGSVDTQAGSHPYETTFAVAFNQLASGEVAGGQPRNLETELPPGFFGEPGATPQCTRALLDAQACPIDTEIGTNIVFRANFGPGGPGGYEIYPLFNMVPPPGVADEFAMSFYGLIVLFDSNVSSAGGYNIVTHVNNIPQVDLEESIVTLWGVAPEASHNATRISENPDSSECIHNGCSSSAVAKPFLTLPTSCEGPQSFAIHGSSTWTDENEDTVASVPSHDETGTPTGFTGCGSLSFAPSLSAVPDTSFADTPAGLSVEVKVPQEGLREPEGVVASTLKNTAVALPAGVVINPGQAAGLTACQEEQANVHGEGPQSCPLSSKVGTVKIQTPLLEGELESELEGDVYVLQSNPPELKLLLAASGDGVYLKLVGTVHLCESAGEIVAGPGALADRTCQAPGQLITTFEETPSLPFTLFKLTFSGGAQAALDTPTQCGLYSTSYDFTPWASPFGADVLGSGGFLIEHGPKTLSEPNGSPCPGAQLPFTPELIAGATNPKGGAFTNFSLLLRRGDGQQRIEKLSFKAPAGLGGMLSTVPLCPEPQASKGECSEASKIGHATVASGPGPYPLVLPEPGNPEFPIYLTGPYGGAPFGLSIVSPIIAGPFNLGTIVTRAKIEIDPHTAQITVTTEPLPQVIDGVPTDLRLIDSVIERPGFMFNPTHCAPASFSGTASGTPPAGQGGPGASAPISTSFDLVGCKGLAFTPKFTASTEGKTSKSDGASLTLKVTRETGPASDQANFALAKIELPKALPSRLTTLQRACLAATFEANPAKCPPESDIGHIKVVTPELPVPLEGPAYFVSHGGEAFPSVIFVLQGDNVTIDVVSTTYISKSGITSATIKAAPDAPFTSFELTFPEKPFSALGTNKNLCAPTQTVTVKKRIKVKVHGKTKTVTRKTTKTVAEPLQMPTEFIAQNGAEFKQSTPVTVTGCPKAHPATKKAKAKGKKGKKKK
jgi:hypothetical protein